MANGGQNCTLLPSLSAACCWRRFWNFCAGLTPKRLQRAGGCLPWHGRRLRRRSDAAGCPRAVFAQGLSTIGFINGLISIATSFGSASIILMLVLVILTMLAAMTTGSGNAPFYAFVEMIPKLAHSSGINPAYLSIPMLQASNLGRTISPVSGVVVAVAGMAKISPFEVVKRTSVPVLVGLLVVIVATEILVPGSAVR